jgi:hypothetical protein
MKAQSRTLTKLNGMTIGETCQNRFDLVVDFPQGV